MSDNNDLTLAKLEAATQIISAFARSMGQPSAHLPAGHAAVTALLVSTFKAVWKAIDESVGK